MKNNLIPLNIIIIFCAFFSSEITFAQLGFCNGNSGDPIFIETFGAGVGQNALPAGTTTYAYANGVDPNDGFYAVSNTTNYFDWFSIQDHTAGDTNGKMLVINSDFTSGEFYRTTVSGLCANTSYEFSSWLINLNSSNGFCGAGVIPINVSFEIWDNTDTNLLASGSTGNIGSTTSANWLQYGLVFQTLPGQASVILKMKNNGVGGCGNDLAIDDIFFKSCGDNITTSDDSNNNNETICSSQTPYSTTLTVTPDNSVFANHFYQWQESVDGITWTDIVGETAQTITVSGINNTMYYRAKVAESAVNLNNSQCNVVSEVFQLTVNQLPPEPATECWETATVNDTTCSWEITGAQPSPPIGLECWETTSFNNTTCMWQISGTQPAQPTGLECWETSTFNNTTCTWEVSGTQPAQPTTECWQTAAFNNATCMWELSGTQPAQPIGLECWETSTFNNTTCIWEVSGTQPTQPTTECWETSTFNNTTCMWEVTGTQPTQPSVECWETTTFNNTTCMWEVTTGTQPVEPTGLECWETTTFNSTTCMWEIIGDQPIDNIEEFVMFCEGETITLQANTTITNPTYLWNTGEITSFNTVSMQGIYSVEVTDGCATTVITFNVEQIDVPIIETISSIGTSIVITTVNTGNFLYSLDGITYQSNTVFYNVEGGQYSIYVKANNCIEVAISTYLHFYIPQFFTPNGDTINNTFDLKGIEHYGSSQVQIFNRFGKLLKSTKNAPFSWDGTFNGNPLPTSDYWYVIIIEGQRRVGHFALKR
ncbi:T9SS type B sorting domain-containing protein [Lacinutrix sp. Bg11-31]|uniref:T9SS type B sorting domain-containing protein n=1 Tax=Lacinutrix sp. Bg11-31 TaxID=2057808 RepID=UPI000C3128E0|nr:T9SS type B sorting domain-containing protein [Lacinutrix sp. Bg11-31]AUC82866.1 hypothetical protein CW733_12325 [Lacinutrix sp. Bg11-31]